MNNLNLKPALRYQITYLGKFFLIAFGIIVAVYAFLHLFFSVAVTSDTIEINMSDSLLSVLLVMLFIIGIVGIREDLKMFLQHGAGRRTVYVSTLISGFFTAVVLGLICELFSLFFTVGQSFFGGWLFNGACFFFAWQLGGLISLIYYRMNRIQQIVFSVAGGSLLGALAVFVLPYMAAYIPSGMWAAPTVPILLCGLLAAAFNFLLLRRAQVKE